MTLESVPSKMYPSKETHSVPKSELEHGPDEESRLETYHRSEVIVEIRFRSLCRSLEQAIFDKFQ